MSEKRSAELKKKYSDLLDEELVLLAKEGDYEVQEYIISKYENFVKSKAKSYFLIGADKEDIYQEGMIGLFKAMRDFKADKLSSFKAFAELCITRQIITAIKTASRQKHRPLNTYVSINRPLYDEESEKTLEDTLVLNRIYDPEEIVVSKEKLKTLQDEMNESLSSLELEVLTYYLSGKSYHEIAIKLQRQAKSIDNALQRVKRKLEKCLDNL
ncbi:MAG: RNA polymerase sporulation sigma factor SigH [Oscillospiraceae bacterium]|nr:RNA polymerase sporulation sigma factor SigH [Oscillospiraceae bacterium]